MSICRVLAKIMFNWQGIDKKLVDDNTTPFTINFKFANNNKIKSEQGPIS